jgi:surface antigen
MMSRAPVLAVLALVLGGCMGGGAPRDTAEPDPTILTGAVAEPAPTTSVDYQSDEATIRNAVSAADLEIMAGAPLPWANADTGSRGAVHALAEVRNGANLCRSFTASRESFDGVAMYRGEACMVAPGQWRMQQFRPL